MISHLTVTVHLSHFMFDRPQRQCDYRRSVSGCHIIYIPTEVHRLPVSPDTNKNTNTSTSSSTSKNTNKNWLKIKLQLQIQNHVSHHLHSNRRLHTSVSPDTNTITRASTNTKKYKYKQTTNIQPCVTSITFQQRGTHHGLTRLLWTAILDSNIFLSHIFILELCIGGGLQNLSMVTTWGESKFYKNHLSWQILRHD